MLLLKIFFTTYQPSPDKGRLTCYELISYPFEIIIGLQKYGFSLNWQTISVFFWIYSVDNEPQAICRKSAQQDKKRLQATSHTRSMLQYIIGSLLPAVRKSIL